MKYCEFIGDKTSPWNGKKKKRCRHISAKFTCLKYKGEELLLSSKGWVLCCKECKEPIYES